MSRYGIAEWYGMDFIALPSQDRKNLATVALGNPKYAPTCPFRAIQCNKKGGVCSLQAYTEMNGRISATEDPPVIVCPNRFEQNSVLV